MVVRELTTGSPRVGRTSRRVVAGLGPAFVAAVAYVDPGNFATNFSAGGGYGYALVWVVVAANLIGVLVQSLSAKLGLATGHDLAELCRDRLPRPVTIGLWLQAEAVAMATDLAEVLGGALGLQLLLGMSLPLGAAVTAIVAVGLTAVQSRSARRFEMLIAGFLAILVGAFTVQLVAAPPEPAALVRGLTPVLAGPESAVFAIGILGATVMPHAIYAHSALAGRDRYVHPDLPTEWDDRSTRRFLRWQRVDILTAMGSTGLLNVAMLAIGAGVFTGHSAAAASLPDAQHRLASVAGGAAALAFAVALLAAGFASAGVGTYAGQVIMHGFLRRRVPLTVRRLVTLTPALLVIALGIDPTVALVASQVVLSFGIPFALLPLIAFTSRRTVMGALVNRRSTTTVAMALALVIVMANGWLVAMLLR